MGSRPAIQKTIFAVAIAITFNISVVSAECNLEEDGDCCKKDTDCEVFVYEALCTVMPINKNGAEKLKKESPTPLSSCTADVVSQLKKDAASQKAKCVDSACEFE